MTTEHHPLCDDNGWDHPGRCVTETHHAARDPDNQAWARNAIEDWYATPREAVDGLLDAGGLLVDIIRTLVLGMPAMPNYVWVVRRNDPLDHEIDVFAGDDYATAQRFADAVDGTATEEPILKADDEYVLQNFALDEDARFECNTCGRRGNHDDGINYHGEECPAEDCDGVVQLMEEK